MKKSLIYPFLLAVFPILFLFSHNLSEKTSFLMVVIPLLVALAATFLIYMSLKIALKNSKKAGLITSVFLVLFFSYGHFYDFIYSKIERIYFLSEILIPLAIALPVIFCLFLFLKRTIKEKKKLILTLSVFFIAVLALILVFSYGQVFNFIISHMFLKTFFKFLLKNIYEVLSLFWVAILIFVSYRIIKSKSSFDNLTKYLNNVLIILVAFLLLQIGIAYGTSTNHNKIDINKIDVVQEETILPANELPDIYYIILDAYGRADKLNESFGYDNSGFIKMLTDNGFYVASKSRSNYKETIQSLPSSLNMGYINFLTERLNKNRYDTKILYQMIENNEIIDFLKARGYLFVHVSSGADMTAHNENADIEYFYSSTNLNEFDQILIETTWLRKIVLPLINEKKGERILYNFEKIGEVPNIKEPTFLFAHIHPPHSPYIFDQQGNLIPDKRNKWEDPCEQKQAYIDQLIFVNKKTEELVDKLLSRSERPPIIIIQSDHGPPPSGNLNRPTETSLKERMANLNAYYLPNGGDKLLYDSITPVNSFRLIFDFYFNASYGLLEDKSYFSKPGPYVNFVLVPDEGSVVWDILNEKGLTNQEPSIKCNFEE